MADLGPGEGYASRQGPGRLSQEERFSAIVADRRHLLRSALGTLLRYRANITLIDEATTPAETLELVDTTSPDFLLLSAELAEVAIYEILGHAQTQSPRIHIVVISEGTSLRERVVTAVARAGHTVVDWNAAPMELLDNLRRHTTLLLAWRHGDLHVQALSKREIEVLHLVAEGLSNREIGIQLSISGGTVKHHLAKIFERLHAHSRVQAINQAIAAGLLEPPTFH